MYSERIAKCMYLRWSLEGKMNTMVIPYNFNCYVDSLFNTFNKIHFVKMKENFYCILINVLYFCLSFELRKSNIHTNALTRMHIKSLIFAFHSSLSLCYKTDSDEI